MHYTQHAIKRMQNRGIPSAMINLALEYGEIDQDAYEIDSHLAEEHIKSLQYEKYRLEENLKWMKKIKDKGGIRVIISDDNRILTAYDSDSRHGAY